MAVGVLHEGKEHEGKEYVEGFGITNVDYPVPVGADTVFRVGSTTKTFTGTTVMRLVDRGLIDLDARVHRYLPGPRTSDPRVARQVNAALELAGHLIEVVTCTPYEKTARNSCSTPSGSATATSSPTRSSASTSRHRTSSTAARPWSPRRRTDCGAASPLPGA